MQIKAKLDEDMNDKQKSNNLNAQRKDSLKISALSEISEEDSNKSDLYVSMGRNQASGLQDDISVLKIIKDI